MAYGFRDPIAKSFLNVYFNKRNHIAFVLFHVKQGGKIIDILFKRIFSAYKSF
ncbi:hypothetical protein B0H98_10435 [Vreelandella songnenensis]|uniref:Uncharacterized protein n=1 Tax=Vreelandella songnenensis TaxID=1176243 RepID=A0A2T0V3J3_9GAMM|nr:hypothetical protein B0H98_10435 [Halomonas songnenensis]